MLPIVGRAGGSDALRGLWWAAWGRRARVNNRVCSSRSRETILPQRRGRLRRGGDADELPALAQARCNGDAGVVRGGRRDALRCVARLCAGAVDHERAAELRDVRVALGVAEVVDLLERAEAVEEVRLGLVGDPVCAALEHTCALDSREDAVWVARGAADVRGCEGHVASGRVDGDFGEVGRESAPAVGERAFDQLDLLVERGVEVDSVGVVVRVVGDGSDAEGKCYD